MKRNTEQRIIWEIIKIHYGTGDDVKLKELVGRCNVDLLKRLTALTGIEGFLYSIGSSEPVKELLPEKYLSYLQQIAGIAAIKNNFVIQNGIEVAKLLNDHQIEYVLIKGIAALRQLYDDPMARAVSDLDIVIKREHYGEVKELLLEAGFYYPQEQIAKIKLKLSQEEFEDVSHEISYHKDTIPFPTSLDLHFNLSGFGMNSMMHQLYPIDRHDWFDNLHIIEMDGCKIRCLNHEMTLLNMIYHFSIHHSFRNLKWLLDICQMVVKYNERIDWRRVDQTAAHPNLRKLIGISLAMVKEVTGISRFGEYSVCDFINKKIPVEKHQNMAFADINKMQARIRGRIIRLRLPVTFADRMRVLGYDLFDRNSIVHRTGTEKKTGLDLFQPFRLIGFIVKNIFDDKK